MPTVNLTNVDIEYDLLGDADAATILLIAGSGSQLTAWEAEFCGALVDRGFQALRFDHRDVGLSSDLSGLGMPDIDAVAAGAVPPPYTLDDMAQDAASLLAALGIPAAHVVGASMGGSIAQLLAINHPEKVLSVTTIMATLGGADTVPNTLPRAAPPGPGASADDAIEQMVAIARMVSGGVYFNETRTRALVREAIGRSIRPTAARRHLAAVLAAPSRAEALRRLAMPLLVIHGEADPLIPFENALRVAAAAPGSTLIPLPDVGHELPPEIWPTLVDAITEHALGAGAPPAAPGRQAGTGSV